MSRPRLHTTTLPDTKYLSQQLLSPMSQSADYFTSPDGLGPLVNNWSYDSAIDFFPLNPDVSSLPFGFGSELTGNGNNTKDLFMDPFSTSSFNGLSMPSPQGTVSPSSNFGDEQIWTSRLPTDMSYINQKPPSLNIQPPNPLRRTVSDSTTSTWSSGPQTPPPQEDPTIVTTPKRATHSPKSPSSPPPTKSRKHSTSSSSTTSTDTTHEPPSRNAAKRAAHNIIEKRYRTNMNAKFLALETAVSPGGIQKSPVKGRAASLKKSEILGSALDHIEKIQRENRALREEIAGLKRGVGRG